MVYLFTVFIVQNISRRKTEEWLLTNWERYERKPSLPSLRRFAGSHPHQEITYRGLPRVSLSEFIILGRFRMIVKPSFGRTGSLHMSYESGISSVSVGHRLA